MIMFINPKRIFTKSKREH